MRSLSSRLPSAWVCCGLENNRPLNVVFRRISCSKWEKKLLGCDTARWWDYKILQINGKKHHGETLSTKANLRVESLRDLQRQIIAVFLVPCINKRFDERRLPKMGLVVTVFVATLVAIVFLLTMAWWCFACDGIGGSDDGGGGDRTGECLCSVWWWWWGLMTGPDFDERDNYCVV